MLLSRMILAGYPYHKELDDYTSAMRVALDAIHCVTGCIFTIRI